MTRFIIFSGLFTSLGISQVDIFDSFLRFIHQDSGIRMNINFHQTQFGESYTEAGTFYYLQDGYYIYDSQKQRIIVNGDTITTINKHAKQIIYDLSIPGNVNIFDILTGNMDGIKREPAILEKSGYRILGIVRCTTSKFRSRATNQFGIECRGWPEYSYSNTKLGEIIGKFYS